MRGHRSKARGGGGATGLRWLAGLTAAALLAGSTRAQPAPATAAEVPLHPLWAPLFVLGETSAFDVTLHGYTGETDAHDRPVRRTRALDLPCVVAAAYRVGAARIAAVYCRWPEPLDEEDGLPTWSGLVPPGGHLLATAEGLWLLDWASRPPTEAADVAPLTARPPLLAYPPRAGQVVLEARTEEPGHAVLQATTQTADERGRQRWCVERWDEAGDPYRQAWCFTAGVGIDRVTFQLSTAALGEHAEATRQGGPRPRPAARRPKE